MFAARTNTLLTVHSSLESRQRRGGVHCAGEDGLELVHTCVGEEERGVVHGHDGRARNHGMVFVLEVADELGTHVPH